jgi:hypothetical protein
MPTEPTKSTLKALGALSGNVCAFPGCVAPIYDTVHGKLVGQVCHIRAENKLGPRYDEDQSDEERHGFHNLLFMCVPHHLVIDDPANLESYTVEALTEIKRNHESCNHNTIMTEDVLERLVRKVLEIQSPPALQPSLQLLVESARTGADNQMGIDYYDFRIKLRNDGPATARQYRIEIEIPNAFFRSNSTYPAEVKDHNRGDVHLFRFTEQGHPGFTLYPGDTSYYLILLDYSVSMEQYIQITGNETIKVSLFSGDELLQHETYPIAEFLNEERCRGWWTRNEDRPQALQHPRKYHSQPRTN